ncbi:MAG: triose-phosphate isomerase [Acidobacteriales bacterium]|nr:triose-phosphate isomerase [Terriglobales bacterium]
MRHDAAEALEKDIAEKLRTLYGGSVKPEDAKALMASAELDGAPVGGPAWIPSHSRRSCTTARKLITNLDSTSLPLP